VRRDQTVIRALAFIVLSLSVSREAIQLPAPSTSNYHLQPAPVLENSDAYDRLPRSFEANQGQSDESVKFLSRGSGHNVYLRSTDVVFVLSKTRAKSRGALKGENEIPDSSVIRMRLLGGDAEPALTGEDELPGKTNYFLGNDSARWRTDIPSYAKVRCRGVYTGIDVIYYGRGSQLEYDFVVAPGADPRLIQLAFEGSDRLSINRGGDLVIESGDAEIRMLKPVAYQDVMGNRAEIPAEYLLADGQVRFKLGPYDVRSPLIIDPVVSYSTYLGGGNSEFSSSIAVDGAGNMYLTGITDSPNFPTVNPLKMTNPSRDTFVIKLNPAGSAIVFSTYLGGGNIEQSGGIAVDTAGNVYVTGETWSTDFPTANPFQPAMASGPDAFVSKLNAAGSALIYSTYLGGGDIEESDGIAVDASGNAYVVGSTQSTNFPTANALQPTNGYGYDIFVSKLNAAGSSLIYSTYLGGNNWEMSPAIAIDGSGNVYVTGLTYSMDFPTINPLQPSNGGLSDAFVSKLNAAGSALIYSTFFGGGAYDAGTGIAVDPAGNAYVTGHTRSTDFPIANPLQATNAGATDTFVSKLNAAGSTLVYSTYLGGTEWENPSTIALDADGNAYVAGDSLSTNFPTVDPLQPVNPGTNEIVVSKLNPEGSALLYSTYFGGDNADQAESIAVDASGNAYVVGVTYSTNFPVVSPVQAANAGNTDVFVIKISAKKRRGQVVSQ